MPKRGPGREGQSMKLIDHSVIVSRLRIVTENIFQVSNQAVYLRSLYPSAMPLIFQMGNRLHCCLDDLGRIMQDIEPKKVDVGSLTLEEDLLLSGYDEIKQGLLKYWEFIESREQAINRQAETRIQDTARGQGQ